MGFRKMVMITLYARQQKRHRCIEQSFLYSVGEGEGGMIWENGIETWIISYIKWKNNNNKIPFKKNKQIFLKRHKAVQRQLT